MIVLGIDFGTSNNCCSFFDGNNFKLIPNEYGNYIYPTCIFLDTESETILYANSALDLSINQTSSNVFNIRQLITDNKESITLTFNKKHKTFTINEIVVLYLKYLKNISQEYIGNKKLIQNIVITVPVYYSDNQRKRLKSCCENSDLNVIKIINEPIAAILAYKWNEITTKYNSKNILVIDCNSETTYYSIINTNSFKMINNLYNNKLGGNNLTETLFNYILNKICKKINKQLQIKQLCEQLKRELSFKETSSIYIDSIDVNFNISRNIFYDINSDFFKSIKLDILKVTDNLSIKIDEIIFVGGTTRIPKFINICKDIFGNSIIINNSIDPEHSVSKGAAIQGYLLTNTNQNTLDLQSIKINVTPMTLGFKTYDNKMVIIISKHTPIPVSKSQIFTNSEETDSLSFDIYQGNTFLQKITLHTKKYKRGEMRIEITFSINSEGILSIKTSAKNDKTSIDKIIEKYDNTISSDSDIDDLDLDLDSI